MMDPNPRLERFPEARLAPPLEYTPINQRLDARAKSVQPQDVIVSAFVVGLSVRREGRLWALYDGPQRIAGGMSNREALCFVDAFRLAAQRNWETP